MVATSLPTDGAGLYFLGTQGLYMPAGERVGSTDFAIAHIRPVHELLTVVSTPTLTVGGAYATGDYVGPSAAPASFASAAREAGKRVEVKSLAITDKTVTAAVALELWLFEATFTAPTDNAAWDISDAHALLCKAVVPIPTTGWYASASNKVFSAGNLGLVLTPTGTSIFYALVARGTTPAWATGDLQLTLGIRAD